MPKGNKYYAVAVGRKTGVFNTWSDCQKQTKGFPKAKFKSFKTQAEARSFVSGQGSSTTASIPPAAAPAAAAAAASANAPDFNRKINGDSRTNRGVAARSSSAVSGRRGRNETPASLSAPMMMQPSSKRQRLQTSASGTRLKVHMMFDGGARGNPGVGGSGAFVTIQDATDPVASSSTFRRTVHIRYYAGPMVTNNQAEYQGLLYGLSAARREVAQFAKSQNLTIDLIVQGDSNLIIEQLKGAYRCNSEKLKPLYRRAKALLAFFSSHGTCNLTLEHVYRNNNKVADGLANEAMDSRRSWFTMSDDDHGQQHDITLVDPTAPDPKPVPVAAAAKQGSCPEQAISLI